ncbi:MAG: chitobiase/beta-hexosaminidase C-terminal domain-containing protein, partial [Roseburia sp.]
MYEKEEKKKGQSHVSWWKVFLVLAICLSGILLPISGIAANTGVQTINRDITVLRPGDGNTWNKTDGHYLYFGTEGGGQNGFRVLNSSPDTQTTTKDGLLLERNISGLNLAMGSVNWVSSNPRTWLNGNQYYGNSARFSTLEKGLIQQTTLKQRSFSVSGKSYSDPNSTDWVFLLSEEEQMTLYPDANARKKSTTHLLTRSYGYYPNVGIGGLSNGNPDIKTTSYAYAMAPAMNLDATSSSILFAAENDNAKTAALAAPASSNKKAWKLTLLDSSKSVELRDGLTLAKDGDTIIVPYSHSGNGENRITVMITDKEVSDNTFEILYYGSLQDVRDIDGNAVTGAAPQKGSGTFEFPSTLNIDEWGTTYHVYLMAEQVNAANYTDYASTPVAIELPQTERQKIDQVNITYTKPEPTESFPEKTDFTIEDGSNNDISTWGTYTIEWYKKENSTLTSITPGATGDTADYATDYVVKVNIQPDDSHYLAKNTMIKINGVALSNSTALVPGAVGDYYNITAEDSMRTRNPRITSIVTPDEIPLDNGVTKETVEQNLPAKVKINVEDNAQREVDVTWQDFVYNRENRTEHTVTINGTIGSLPTGVDQADPIPITATTVTVKIQAAQEIGSVAVTLDAPMAGQNFAQQGVVSTAHVSTPVSVTWKKGADTASDPAGFDSAYTAEFSMEADYGYVFAAPLQVTINGDQSTSVTVNSSNSKISATVSHTFANTRKAVLTSITTPTYSEKLPNRTARADIKDLLGQALQQVEIIYEGDKKTTAPVTWSEPGTVYNPDILAEQTFVVEGTVILPSWIDAGSIPEKTSATVTVKKADAAKAPTADLNTQQTYTTNQFVNLSSTTPDAEIYYTLNGTDPDKNSNKYTVGDPILITGVEGRQEIVTLKAIAYKEHMYPSPIAEFRYTMELAKTIPSVALTDIAAPTVNQPFDTVASTASAGVSTASLGVQWTEKGGAAAVGNVKYHTVYVASLDLAPAQY